MRGALEAPPPPETTTDRPGSSAPWNLLVTLALLGGAIIALYAGQDILIPLALAALLSFVLAPLVDRLRSWGLPRLPAVLLVVLLAFAAIGGFGVVVGNQLAQLAANLPTYQDNIRTKLQALRDANAGGGIVEQASSMLHELGQELQQVQDRQNGRPASSAGTSRVTIEQPTEKPITVRVEEPPLSPIQVIETVALPLLAPVGTAGIVLVFVVFMLLERQDLRDRLIRLVGGGDFYRTTEVLSEAATRVSRYLLMQLVVNATYGVPIGVGLWLIGVPNALLWGMLATVLRFVPYIGPFIAALFPVVLAIAVDPGWNMVLWTAALFLLLELISNNVVEPWLYGASTGISTVAILVAAIFWTTLWGPVGLLLSTPLTVCLAVLGRYVPQLAFLDVLLGSEPVLTPAERFYQRMLAADPDEALAQAELLLKESTLAGYYDEVALKGLRLATSDGRQGTLPLPQLERIQLAVNELVEDLAEREDATSVSTAAAAAPATASAASPQAVEAAEAPREPYPERWRGERAVLCLAGRGPLDEAVSSMLAQLLRRQGLGADVVPHEAASRTGIFSLNVSGAAMVCISYLDIAGNPAHLRYLIRRLRHKLPGAPILVGLWPAEEAVLKDPTLRAEIGADHYVTSLTEAVAACLEAAAPSPAAEPAQPQPRRAMPA